MKFKGRWFTVMLGTAGEEGVTAATAVTADCHLSAIDAAKDQYSKANKVDPADLTCLAVIVGTPDFQYLWGRP